MSLELVLGLSPRSVVGFVPPPPPAFSSVAANGWQATVASPSDLSFAPTTVSRAGFNSSASAITIADTLLLTKRVRQAFPNQASFTADQVALSDYVYADDVIAGATNNSAESSPRPIANWQMVERLTVGDSVYWEIAAFHRDARLGAQVACVRVRANDGTNQTAWQTVSTTSVSAHVEDANPLEVYSGTLSISGLANPALIWLEAEVYPHFGVTASVLRSEDVFAGGGYLPHHFGRRFFRRDTARAAAPSFAYVSSSGIDASGVISTTAATAKATPFLTVAGALIAARTALGTTNGTFDNFTIRIINGVNTGTVTALTYWQDIGAVIVERDPDVSRATAVVTVNSAFRPRFSNKSTSLVEGSIIFRDCSVAMGGAFSFQGEAANQLYAQFVNCNFNFGSFSTGLRSNSHLALFGCQLSNYNQNLSNVTNQFIRVLRGCTGNMNDQSYTVWNLCGNTFTRPGTNAQIDRNVNGRLIYNNKFLDHRVLNPALEIVADAAGNSIGSFALVQNIVERTATGSTQCLRITADSANGNAVNGVVHHNVFAGFGAIGRCNVLYDDTVGTARSHKLVSFVGNIFTELNTKSDRVMADGTRQGNWFFEHGAACNGNFIEGPASDPNFEQAYVGIGSLANAGNALFVDRETVSSGPLAGNGNGDYDLQSGSPARGIVTRRVLAFDIAGAARGTGAQDAGAYA